MPLISRNIPNFWQGVTQQPQELRGVGQADDQENAFNDVATGMDKRPPTVHEAFLTPSGPLNDNAKVHFAIRDNVEQYVMMIEPSGTLTIRDFAGTAMTIVDPSLGQLNYFASTTPRQDLFLLTVDDTTFVLNRTKVAAFDGSVSSGTLTGTVQSFANLPGSPVTGQIYRITGNDTTGFTDYYVRYNGTVWEEWVAPGINSAFSNTTMPWTIRRTAVNTFTIEPISWSPRRVGDALSAPAPSFIGQTINAVFFYRNRLGFLSKDTVVMSRAGDFYNLWPESARVIADSDPIDINASSKEVVNLLFPVEYNKTMFFLSPSGQFELLAGDILSPKTARVDLSTAYDSSTLCPPVAVGASVMFVGGRGEFSQVREYRYSDVIAAPDAEEVTKHVPNYVPANVFQIEAATQENTLFVSSLNARNTLYVYKYLWRDAATRVQTSWTRWTLGPTDVVLGMKAIRNMLYVVINRAGQRACLESINLQPNLLDVGMGFLVRLDRRVLLTGSYNAGTNTTTWTLPYSEGAPGVTYQAVLGSGYAIQKGRLLALTLATATTVTCPGNFSAAPVYIGRRYTLRHRLSQLLIRDQNGSVFVSAKTVVRMIHLNVGTSGYVKTTVTANGRDPVAVSWTGQEINVTPVNALALSSGIVGPYSVGAPPDEVTIEFTNDTPFPSRLLSMDWESTFYKRAR
jgi:hypothetical protein